MKKRNHPESPVDVVSRKLAKGIDRHLAQMLGVSPSTLSCWRNPERRGAVPAGTIPQRYHALIFSIAKEKGVTIHASELV